MQKYIKLITKLSSESIDIRRLNFVKMQLQKESNLAAADVSINKFLKIYKQIMREPNFEESEIWAMMRDIIKIEKKN